MYKIKSNTTINMKENSIFCRRLYPLGCNSVSFSANLSEGKCRSLFELRSALRHTGPETVAT